MLTLAFFFDMAVAHAAEIVSQTQNDSNAPNSLTTAAAILSYQEEDAGFATTGYVNTFTTDTAAVTSISILIHNAGGSTCTATTVAASAPLYYCNSGSNCTGGNRVFGTFSGGDNVNVAPGADQWVEMTVASVAANRIWFFGGIPLTSISNCESTYPRYWAANVISGSRYDNDGATPDANKDLAFRMCTGGTDCGAAYNPGPVISNKVELPFPKAFRITFDTDVVGTTKLKYGATSSYGTTVNQSSDSVMSHSIGTGILLSHSTTYHYSVCSTGTVSGVETCTADDTIDTLSDRRTSPISSFSLPTSNYSSSLVTYKAKNNVCINDYAGEALTFEFYAEKNSALDCGGSWSLYGTEEVTYAAHPLLQSETAACYSGLAYGVGGIPDPTFAGAFENGCYRMKVRSKVGSGSYGSYTSTATFTVGSLPVGGGGGGSWGDDDEGGAAGQGTWQTELDAVPSHDTVYGACDFWGSTSGDGIECLWSWIKYFIFPPADVGVIDFLSLPMQTLGSRWPFVYFTTFVARWQAAISGDGDCPLPSFFTATDDYAGVNIPTFNACTPADQIAGVIEANSTAVSYIQIILWVSLVGFSVVAFKDFFSQ